MEININNIAEVIFKNYELYEKLRELRPYFEMWRMSCKLPIHFRHQNMQSRLDFLDNINERHIQILSEYFKEDITINKLDVKTTKNYQYPVEKAQILLNSYERFADLALYRDEDQLYVSFWK